MSVRQFAKTKLELPESLGEAEDGGRKRSFSGPHGFDQRPASQYLHHTFQIVGKDMEGHFRADPIKGFCQEVRLPIHNLRVPKGCSTVWRRIRMLSRVSQGNLLVRRVIEAELNFLECFHLLLQRGFCLASVRPGLSQQQVLAGQPYRVRSGND